MRKWNALIGVMLVCLLLVASSVRVQQSAGQEPEPTIAPTETPIPNETPTPTETPSPIPTETFTPTFTATSTETETPTPTETSSPTSTSTLEPSQTPIPSESPTPFPSATITSDLAQPIALLNESFEFGSGLWVVSGIGGRSEFETAHTGEWLFSDSVAGWYQPNTITTLSLTQPIGIPAKARTLLQYWQWVDIAGGDSAQVQISTDNSAWTTLVNETETHNPAWHVKTLDLSPYSGQYLYLRFVFSTDPDTQTLSDGWLLDDISIIAEPLPLAPRFGFSELETDNPDVWLTEGSWQPIDWNVHSGGIAWSATSQPQTSVALTLNADISLGMFSQPQLSFWHILDVANGADQARVDVSTDSGQTWQPVAFYSNPDNTSVWVQRFVDLSPLANQSIRVRFLLATDNDGLQGAGWAVDSVSIQEASSIPLTPTPTETATPTPTAEDNSWIDLPDTDPALHYGHGAWQTVEIAAAAGRTLTYSLDPGATLSLFFEATDLHLLFSSGPEGGTFTATLDGQTVQIGNSLSSSYTYSNVIAFENLTDAPHTLQVVNQSGAIWIEGLRLKGRVVFWEIADSNATDELSASFNAVTTNDVPVPPPSSYTQDFEDESVGETEVNIAINEALSNPQYNIGDPKTLSSFYANKPWTNQAYAYALNTTTATPIRLQLEGTWGSDPNAVYSVNSVSAILLFSYLSWSPPPPQPFASGDVWVELVLADGQVVTSAHCRWNSTTGNFCPELKLNGVTNFPFPGGTVENVKSVRLISTVTAFANALVYFAGMDNIAVNLQNEGILSDVEIIEDERANFEFYEYVVDKATGRKATATRPITRPLLPHRDGTTFHFTITNTGQTQITNVIFAWDSDPNWQFEGERPKGEPERGDPSPTGSFCSKGMVKGQVGFQNTCLEYTNAKGISTSGGMQWVFDIAPGTSRDFSQVLYPKRSGAMPIKVIVYFEDGTFVEELLPAWQVNVTLIDLNNPETKELVKSLIFWMIYNETSEDGYEHHSITNTPAINPNGVDTIFLRETPCIEELNPNDPTDGWLQYIIEINDCDPAGEPIESLYFVYLHSHTILNGFLNYERDISLDYDPYVFFQYAPNNYEGSLGDSTYAYWHSINETCKSQNYASYGAARDTSNEASVRWLHLYKECLLNSSESAFRYSHYKATFETAWDRFEPYIDQAISDFIANPQNDPVSGAIFLLAANYCTEYNADGKCIHGTAYVKCVGGCEGAEFLTEIVDVDQALVESTYTVFINEELKEYETVLPTILRPVLWTSKSPQANGYKYGGYIWVSIAYQIQVGDKALHNPR